jgi:isochorismate hydrolase
MDIKSLFNTDLNIKSLTNCMKYLTNSIDIEAKDCLFVMVDIQERFMDIIHEMDEVVKNADILNKAAEILNIPLLVTEQSPEKLGKTTESIYIPKHTYFEKTLFSIFTDEVEAYLTKQNKPVLVIYGIEAHICVTQSCLDAIKRAYHVLLVADAVSSRKKYSKNIAINMLAEKGIEVVTTEMLLFRLLRDAKHPKFRDISKLVK